MSPVTHYLAGWLVANTTPLDRRERAAIVVAAIVPDVDGLGVVAEWLTRNTERPLHWWSDYHHVLGHNLGFCLLVAAVGFGIARQRWTTAFLCLLSFHVHLLGDLAGGRGPDGERWPIPYLLPFSNDWHLAWSGQWALNAWPNFAITAAFIGLTLYLAVQRGFSPLEMFSRQADRVFVETLRRRFPGT